MIVLKLQGGLGNQMFEYAFGRYIQNELDEEKLILDISAPRYPKKQNNTLKHFKLNSSVIVDDSGKYNWRYDHSVNPILKVGYKFWPRFQYELLKNFGVYVWDYAKYIPVQVKASKCVYLHGLWQSENYFPNMEEILRSEFMVTEEILNKNQDIYHQICNTNSVCVHVRRGDFLAPGTKLVECKNSYYREAMEMIRQRITNPYFYIFSDDIENVKKEFLFEGENIYFVEKNNTDYEELRLMSSCKHFIIANSTFSWWASYLGKNDGQITIAPKEWYIDKRDMKETFRKDWVIIRNL